MFLRRLESDAPPGRSEIKKERFEMRRTFFRSGLRSLEDSYVLFLKWLITCTREGHLEWNIQPDVIATKTRSMRVAFATKETTRGKRAWNLFTVADARAQLFRATRQKGASFDLPRHVIALVNSLFLAVWKSGSPRMANKRVGKYSTKER